MVFLGTMFSLGAALAQSFEAYYGLRALVGFTLTAGQTIGLAFIQDMFFFHQHAQKIGIWTSLFLVSPYCGPLFGNFIIGGTGSWRAVMWLVFGLGCFNLVLIVLFVDESWYRRDLPQREQPDRGNRMSRLIGIWQLRVHKGYFLSVATACKKLTYVLVKPIILPILIY
jgi:MFS family permease